MDALINTGIAGFLDARIDIGDIVISTDSLYHDMDASKFGDPVGQIPRMDVFSFEADPRLVELAKEANNSGHPHIYGKGSVRRPAQTPRTRRGSSAISIPCARRWRERALPAPPTSGISYVIIRAISDKADNSASVDYPVFEKQAIAHSVRLVKALFLKLPEKGL